jgi:hypothetical protein
MPNSEVLPALEANHGKVAQVIENTFKIVSPRISQKGFFYTFATSSIRKNKKKLKVKSFF